MTKVVRAFSLDQAVSEDLDLHTLVPGKSKPMNKSKYVNEALRFYMGKNIKEMIEQNRTLKENLTAGLRAKDASIQGLEQQLALSVETIEDKQEYIGSLERRLDLVTDQLIELKVKPKCRCLWCRLKKRLQK